MGYKKFPIFPIARKSGLNVREDSSTVHINCPFCGDRGRRFYLYADTDEFHCFNCCAHGNAVALYASRTGLSYKDAYHELDDDHVLHFPRPAAPPRPEPEPAPLMQRDAVYRAMLQMLPLCTKHYENLLDRGLTHETIRTGGYGTLPYGKEVREQIAEALAAQFDLSHIPGFYFSDGQWQLSAWSGMLIPVRAADGAIQGIQIRRDGTPKNKYPWLSSKGLPKGAGARAWVHVVGNPGSDTACITEGPLKGDAASVLSSGSLFVCVPGVSAIKYLVGTLREFGITQAREMFDMDKRDNPDVCRALQRLRKELARNRIACDLCMWDENFKGIDDYLLACKHAA